MRWWLIAVLGACESTADFPAPPTEIQWHTLELALHRGTLDGTTYEVEVPRGAQESTVARTTTFALDGLRVSIELDQEARSPDEFREYYKTMRDDGWSGSYASTAASYVYVDDGGILCTASVTSSTSEQMSRLRRICASLRVTSPLANPAPYPAGLSPREVRASMCQIAMHHVRALEPAPARTKKRKTKAQLAAEAKTVEELDAAYADRQARCVRQRWSAQQTQCLVQLGSVEEATNCVPTGW